MTTLRDQVYNALSAVDIKSSTQIAAELGRTSTNIAAALCDLRKDGLAIPTQPLPDNKLFKNCKHGWLKGGLKPSYESKVQKTVKPSRREVDVQVVIQNIKEQALELATSAERIENQLSIYQAAFDRLAEITDLYREKK